MRWPGSTMPHGDGVINHPFSTKLDFPWQHTTECAEGILDKKGLVKRYEKLNLTRIAGC